MSAGNDFIQDESIIAEFIDEAGMHIATLERDLLLLESCADPDPETLAGLFRAMHSIKGSAGFLELKGIVSLSHAAESILSRLRDGTLQPSAGMVDRLLEACDAIKVLLAAGEKTERAEHRALIAALTVYLDGTPAEESCPSAAPLAFAPEIAADTPATEAKDLAAADDLCPAPVSAPETVAATAGVREDSAAGADQSVAVPGQGRTIRINVELMDTIMALAGELVLVRNQQLTLLDQAEARMRDNVQRFDSVTSQLQEAIMLTRMQPIGNLFEKLPRVVRDLGRRLGKDIHLELSGKEVELDKIILENLSDPLTHLIRNSCDHGIESPEERIALGKPSAGTISLTAFQEGGQIIIAIKDDGRGIDPARIRASALAKGLRTAAELDAMGDKEILGIIFMPGFSTAAAVSDVSGRGVGMDVVRTCIESLGGNVEVFSSLGKGTRLQLRLPLTLAIIPSVIVRSGSDHFAIPQASLEELVELNPRADHHRIEVAHDQEVFRLRGRLLPVLRLKELLERPEPFDDAFRREIIARHASARNSRDGQTAYMAVVKVGTDRFGILVDEIMGTEEIVVKPIHGLLKRLRCFSGCTIMGDGSVAFILDIDGACRHGGIQFTNVSDEERAVHASRQREPSGAATDDIHDILLFQYGPREQFAIPLTMVQRVETISLDSIQHVGHREFVTRDGVSTYVIRLDRLLGVSAPPEDQRTMHLLLPKFIRRPVGILVSSIVDTAETGILFKDDSYAQDGLLGSMVVGDIMTLFLDIFRLVEMAEPEWFGGALRMVPPPDHRRVLLVEDADFFRKVVRRYLEDGGFEVVTAVNGKDALLHLKAEKFDIVVSDLVMPEMDGWSLAEEVRTRLRWKQLPMLALSSLENEADMKKALQSGFDSYVPKFDRETFLGSVLDLLGRNLQARPIEAASEAQR